MLFLKKLFLCFYICIYILKVFGVKNVIFNRKIIFFVNFVEEIKYFIIERNVCFNYKVVNFRMF